LFLFLLNFRPTLITLTAIPLSIVVTALVFRWFDMTINVMTLGGLAVAMGELVDDAIVDVENIFRRLRQNRERENPRPVLNVIFEASVEVRNAIILSTMLVIVVFSPLFALSGISERMFTPLGIAYIVSILASTVVSLTVTPVLSYFLLTDASVTLRKDGRFVEWLKRMVKPMIHFSMDPNRLACALGLTGVLAVGCGFLLASLGSDYLPDFDEGAVQVNLVAAASTSLQTSREICRAADREFLKLVRTEENPDGPLLWFTCRTGRAEQDEHVMGVNVSEYVMTLNPNVRLSRSELREKLEDAVADLPSVADSIEQPIAHLISHMLSGVETQIAIKLHGDNLITLRRKAEQIKSAILDVEGMAEPMVEQQLLTPQFRIEVRRDQLAYYGINAQYVNDFVETAMKGRVISQIIDGQRRFDLILRLGETYRSDLNNLARIPLELPNGRRVPLSAVARLYEGGGPNTIKREDGRRRIVVRVNTTNRDVGSVLADIKQRVNERIVLPEGYFVEYGGQFEAGQAATQRIAILSVVAFAIVFVLLYSTYPSVSIVMQILIALPVAFIGGALALWATGQILTVAAQVGFISLGGIAARNGLLLMSTYLDEVSKRGFVRDAVVSGSLERMSPVLMTALTTGIGLVPLVWGGAMPGREFLLPIATVILGGLVTSTLCEFLIRPGLFFIFSEEAAESLAQKKKSAFTVHVDAA
jgi:CzcA family heavy metal efflux pump